MKHKTYTDGILYNGDCLKVMPKLIQQGIKVDAIICDIPYGTTACAWDTIIPFDKMWTNLNNLIKDNGAICLFGTEPFSSHLRLSNERMYKYDWIWKKRNATGVQLANCKPLNNIENISVFSKGVTYPCSKNKMVYNPQGLIELNKMMRHGVTSTITRTGNNKEAQVFLQKYTNYPRKIIEFNKDSKKYHPTQKPVALMEYLIKTYSNEGDTILDFTMGSGSTIIACHNLNRKFIGIELNEKYYNITKKKIKI